MLGLSGTSGIAIFASLFFLGAAQNWGLPCTGNQSEIYCHGEFLFTVQRAKLYPDQKIFVDRPLKVHPSVVLEEFDKLGIKGENLNETARQQLLEFVDEYFEKNGTEFEPWDPETDGDWVANPPFLSEIKCPTLREWGLDLHNFWKELGRKIKDDVRDNPDLNSMYYVSHPVIVPGGRFKEFYYWDSYWIQRGLLVSGMTGTVKGMIENFLEMVEHLGFIPNGGRIYYQRSQPPLLLPMIDSYYEVTKDIDFIKDNIRTMMNEFNFFVAHRVVRFNITQADTSEKEYAMARYNVELTEPRPESFSEDYELIESLANDAVADELYANLKTGAESGWDFSSRWYVMNEYESPTQGNLSFTKTRNIIPVDLNSIIYWNAMILDKFCKLVVNNTLCNPEEYRFDEIARLWKESIHEVLWDEESGTWYDFDFVKKQPRKYFFPTNLTPLWVKAQNGDIATFAKRAVNYLQASAALNFPGGVPTSMFQTGLQWDFPNAWAPLQHIVIEALANSSDPTAQEVAFNLTEKWVQSNHLAYLETGAMYEKYDVTIVGAAGAGGEYEVVVGFGWSNGVILDLLRRYGSRLTASWTQIPTTTTTTESTTTAAANNANVAIFALLIPLINVIYNVARI